MTQRLVTVDQLREQLEELLDFVDLEDGEVVVGSEGRTAVVIVPQATLVAMRLALKSHKAFVVAVTGGDLLPDEVTERLMAEAARGDDEDWGGVSGHE